MIYCRLYDQMLPISPNPQMKDFTLNKHASSVMKITQKWYLSTLSRPHQRIIRGKWRCVIENSRGKCGKQLQPPPTFLKCHLSHRAPRYHKILLSPHWDLILHFHIKTRSGLIHCGLFAMFMGWKVNVCNYFAILIVQRGFIGYCMLSSWLDRVLV